MHTAPRSAFTLLELLISISIIIFMTGALIPSFSKYVKNQNLRQAQQQLKNDIRTGQNYALTGSSMDELISGAEPLYWGMKFDNGATTYRYFISTTSSGCYPAAYTEKGKSQSLPGGSVMRVAGGGSTCIYFSFANANSSALTTFQVSDSAGSSCVSVTVNQPGRISLGGITSCN